MPIAFGYHPYLQAPGADRADWQVEIPSPSGCVLDERMIPTGEREAVAAVEGPLGSRTFDDGYLAPLDRARSSSPAAGGGSRSLRPRLSVRSDLRARG